VNYIVVVVAGSGSWVAGLRLNIQKTKKKDEVQKDFIFFYGSR
jgi:hypothetical protein